MEKVLKIIVIMLLFSILLMQIWFLIQGSQKSSQVMKTEPAEQIQAESEALSHPTPTDSAKIAPEATQKPLKQIKQVISKATSYIVEAAKCIGCNLCVANCPAGAISMQDGIAVIDNAKCISCGICIAGNNADFGGCPVGAISKK